ncbi:HlyD family secretion protein [Reichenbachiella carrageenanivorans]|uniref:HlyD family secretion protein n=1 Tax=Reichenbachiella carrageenanivorans TaxID=2979869 RepID=A0ABY6D7F2_9BACT|nr:HlyD family secretion protein [Reichenbachiella carrageenanivorans]UXX81078.1 HlyD family secretion protein [Reichenbachiella carrageenanivorans]
MDREKLLKDFSSYQEVMSSHATKKFVFLLCGIFGLIFIGLFLPWTQNIRARGTLITLSPDGREQSINSVISGRIEKWYVREGELIAKGDTILHLSEMKTDYLDPNLVDKTKNQADAKKASKGAYLRKGQALDQQIAALGKNKALKLRQAQNYLHQSSLKLRSDSLEFETSLVNLDIAQKQFGRQQKLYDQGLKSLTELEGKRQKLQEANNKKMSAENKWLASQSQYINAELNLSTVENDYREKIAKAQSDKMTALSGEMEAESQYNKLSIQHESYTKRASFYYILAPQDGYITKATKSGIGEILKEGEQIFTFVPERTELAVELHVRPLDLPLIREGRKVRLQFDGWPALVFNGWPDVSFGTFGGTIVGYDKVARNGMFRVLVAPDKQDVAWPSLLRLGSGAYGIALLNNVPVWYELWRNLNGFPPDFYTKEEKEAKLKKEVKYE